MTERKAFKDYFDTALVRHLADRLTAVEPRFARSRFLRRAARGLDTLAMMGRVGQIADAMQAALPGPSAVSLRALVASLPPVAPSSRGITEYGYALWPYGEFIARHGLDDIEASFEAMVALTQRFSAEFAVRPFLARDPDDILDRLTPLTSHENEHVRRWVSEGTRTRLPWGKRVPALESRLERRLTLLWALRRDPSPYVQRSVANHLGDILKDDRGRGLDCLEAWSAENHPATRWIVRHAARNLLKQGDERALALFGQAPSEDLVIEQLSVGPKRIRLGGTARLQTAVHNRGDQRRAVRLDYRLVSPGARARSKVATFRIADIILDPGERAEREAMHRFLHRTIRQVRSGRHRFALVVNGIEAAHAEVQVVE
jgi:3-methyladenine DNA glycosylase AlkC